MNDDERSLFRGAAARANYLAMDRVDIEFALEASGTCLWNIEAGHVHSLEMEGEAAMAIDMEMGMDFGKYPVTHHNSI